MDAITGDKLSTRQAQKSIIGACYRDSDMPCTSSGLTPDLIMNPHAMPSRETTGLLMEMMSGKIGSYHGRIIDATPFTTTTVYPLIEMLKDMGFDHYGREKLYNGFTGEEIETEIFMGITYYQRLKHLVKNKIHFRRTGIVNAQTRTPPEGRAKDGGYRLGEMEKDVLNSLGLASFLHEKFTACSDGFTMHICDQCGLICVANPKENLYYCKVCDNHQEITRINTVYNFKYLTQLLAIADMGVKFRTQNSTW